MSEVLNRPRGRRPGLNVEDLDDDIQPQERDAFVSTIGGREAPPGPSGPPTPVTVLPGFLVSHDGTAYWPGNSAVVPESLAMQWIRDGWVTDDVAN
jgi:hypothetical protein